MPKNDLKFQNYACEHPIIPGIILSKMFTYYSQNYAGIIGASLTPALLQNPYNYVDPP